MEGLHLLQSMLLQHGQLVCAEPMSAERVCSALPARRNPYIQFQGRCAVLPLLLVQAHNRAAA
jgi:hypothetical protein